MRFESVRDTSSSPHRQLGYTRTAPRSARTPGSARTEIADSSPQGCRRSIHSAYTREELTISDLEEKLRTAAPIGDDFQARASGKPVDPGLLTHGSSAQRQQWLRTGFESGDPGACDTFSAG